MAIRGVRLDVAAVACDLHDAAARREPPQLLVVQVAGRARDGTDSRMRGDHRCAAGVDGLQGRGLGGVRDIDHDAEAIHLRYECATELAEAPVLLVRITQFPNRYG